MRHSETDTGIAERRPLYILIGCVVGISTISVVLDILNIEYRWSVWEVLVDLKSVLLAAAILSVYWGKDLYALPQMVGLQRFEWKKNLLLFLFPILLYAVPVGGGMLLKEVSLEVLSNIPTLLLGTLFDIPAIYFFSATTILIEEMFFRGILDQTLRRKFNPFSELIIANVLWMFFCLSQLWEVGQLTIPSAASLMLYFFALGLFCSAIARRWGSIWPGYSFRVGIATLTPIILSSHITETDPFFRTSGVLFSAEGVCVALLLIGASILLLRPTLPENEVPPNEISLDYLAKSDNI